MPLPRGLPRYLVSVTGSSLSLSRGSLQATSLKTPSRPQVPLSSNFPQLQSLLCTSTSTTYHLIPVVDCFDARSRRRPALAMASVTQHRHHGGHSHAHGHSHDNTYLTSADKADAGVRITRIGLYINFLMAVGKGIGGYLLNSQSLMADAFHSLTDLVSDFLTLATVSWSLKPPTARFPGGYGKIESLGSLGVSSLLLAGGLGLGWHSCEILYSSFFMDVAAAAGDHAHHGHEHAHSHGGSIFSHSHSHNPADMGIPSIHAAWIAGASIVVKEYLYHASKITLTDCCFSTLIRDSTQP